MSNVADRHDARDDRNCDSNLARPQHEVEVGLVVEEELRDEKVRPRVDLRFEVAEVDLGAAETAPLCEQCHNLFIRNIPVDRRIRFEKEERIARVRTLRLWGLRAAALVLPGLPSFVTGHPLRGTLLTGAVVFLGLRLALPDGLLFEPFGGAPPTPLYTGVLAALVGLLWLGGFLRTWRDTRELA